MPLDMIEYFQRIDFETDSLSKNTQFISSHRKSSNAVLNYDDDLNKSKFPFEYAFRIQKLCKEAPSLFLNQDIENELNKEIDQSVNGKKI